MIALLAEFLRIGVNINQFARALNVAMFEGIVRNLKISALEHSARIRAHILGMREGFEGNFAYLQGEVP